MICRRHNVEMLLHRIDRGQYTVNRCPACIAQDRAALQRAKALPRSRCRLVRQHLLPPIALPFWFSLLLIILL